MRISQTFLAVCGAALLLSPFCLIAQDDAEAQAKAREALKQKLKDLDSQSAPAQAQPNANQQAPQPPKVQPSSQADSEATREALRKKMQELQNPNRPPAQPTAPPPAKTTKRAPAQTSKPPAPAPVETPEPQSAPTPAVTATQETPAPVVVRTPRARPEDTERAREAVRKKIDELNNQSPAAEVSNPPVVTTPAATAPVVQTPPPSTPAPTAPPVAAEPPPAATQAEQTSDTGFAPQTQVVRGPRASPDDIERARQAMRTKLGEVPPSTEPVPDARKPHKREAGTAPIFTRIAGPDSGLSTDKQSRLDQLLLKYRSDQISPEQYHAERAKILAGQ